MNKSTFQSALIGWYNEYKRDLPWRNSTDPYIIWISEVILQQTRVNQGLSYFLKFQKNYPTVHDLARASETRVLKDWEGLGYYSRARNLHSAAKQISEDHNGNFPDTHSEILNLKGVGDYTAAAISSFAFNQPHAVVDGNVFRVLSRIFGVSTPINSTKGKKEFSRLANEILSKKNPAVYNQAIMEFGALQCVPKNPDCTACPLQSFCYAFERNEVNRFPIKEKKNYNRQRFFNYLVPGLKGKVLVEQRLEKDIWQRLYQFPMVEAGRLLEMNEVMAEMPVKMRNLNMGFTKVTDLKSHKLSHQTVHCRIFEVEIAPETSEETEMEGHWVQRKELETLAFPRPLRLFLDRKQLTLPLDN